MEKQEKIIYQETKEERIDKFLAANFNELSRSRLQKLIQDGNIRVNGKIIKSNYCLKQQDEISVELPDAIEPEIHPENIPLDIMYEDTDLLIVNKPKGMVVHPSPGHYTGTLVNALMYHCKEDLSGINGVLRPGIVHRIDMDTTGLLIVCKNDFAHNHIAQQLKMHSITRRYHAIVRGNFSEVQGTVDAPIGRHPNNRLKMAINYKNGKDAVTHYTVLENLKQAAYIECKLETGRTHQIRVHMSSQHHPLLGDILYGGPAVPHVEGQVLHAKKIGFIHPSTGQYIEFDSELPEYFQTLLRKLKL